MTRFRQLFGDGKVLIGMIHLPPLPDYQGSPGMERIIEQAVEDCPGTRAEKSLCVRREQECVKKNCEIPASHVMDLALARGWQSGLGQGHA